MQSALVGSFGQRLAAARRAAKLSQSGLAAKVELQSQTIYRYERGVLKPSSDSLARLATALGVSMEWLISGDGDGPELSATGS